MVEYIHTRSGTKPPFLKTQTKDRRTCVWCDGVLSGRRTRWCSDKCVQAYMVTSPNGIRRAAYERDRGVCALCGLDTTALSTAERSAMGDKWGRYGGPWDADHIVPLCEGGTNFLDNIRTLCRPCHKAQTKALAARRAATKKALKLL